LVGQHIIPDVGRTGARLGCGRRRAHEVVIDG
jgi:hypothetical protein